LGERVTADIYGRRREHSGVLGLVGGFTGGELRLAGAVAFVNSRSRGGEKGGPGPVRLLGRGLELGRLGLCGRERERRGS
jgi:hypothetical protein